MRRTTYRSLVVTIGLLVTGSAFAVDPPAGGDATITVVADGEMPDDVVNLIQLPGPAAGSGSAAGGLSRTNEMPQDAAASGGDFGQSVADEVRARNDVGAAVREEAKQQTRDDNKPGRGRQGPPGN
jgi:hypothetical protein